MKIYMLIFISVIFFLWIMNLVLLKVYCWYQEQIEHKHRENIAEDIPVANRKSFKKKVNSYMYGWMRYFIICVGRIPSYRIRWFFYRYIFNMKIDRHAVVFGGCEFRSPWNIVLGRCVIGANSIIDGRAGVVIEDECVLGSGVHIWTREHSINDQYFRVLKENNKPVEIHKYAWVCSDSSILPGVIIGEGSVLATKACATKSTESYMVYAGIPARQISQRNRDLRYTLDGEPSWHFY